MAKSFDASDNSLRLARHHAKEKNVARSFSYYMMHYQLMPEGTEPQTFEELLPVLRDLSARLVDKGCLEQMKEAYRQSLAVFPNSVDLHLDYSFRLMRNCNELHEAKICLEMALKLKPDLLLLRHHYESVLVSLLERWHFPMLNDSGRNRSFRSAIEETISSWHNDQTNELVILDVGTGCGILSLFASDSKSSVKKTIFACEAAPAMVETARRVLELNHKSSEITLLPKLSTTLTTQDIQSKNVDVLITETFDAGLFGEHVLETLDHAWKYLLAQGSKIIPSKAKVFIALVDCNYVKDNSFVHKTSVGYLDVGGLQIKSQSIKTEPYNCEKLARVPGKFNYLSETLEVDTFNFEDKLEVEEILKTGRKYTFQFKVTESGCLSGLALWFKLNLDAEGLEVIDTKPGSSHCWDQAVFPILPSIECQTGDLLEVELQLKSHFKLKSCQKLGQIRDRNETEKSSNLFLPNEIINRLNNPTYVTKMQHLAYNITNENKEKNIRILDTTFGCIASLQILKIQNRSNLTVFMQPDDQLAKDRIDFISELAHVNKIALNRIDCSNLTDSSESYDIIFVDPVSHSGRLDDEFWSNVCPKLERFLNKAQFYPWRVSVYCVLVESEELVKQGRLLDDASCGDYQIAKIVNNYSVKHHQDLILTTLDHKLLSETVYVTSFDFTDKPTSQEQTTHSAFAKLTQPGTIHALVYWFNLEYGWEVNVSTCDSVFQQAAILIDPTPVDICTNPTASILFHRQQNIVDFEVHF